MDFLSVPISRGKAILIALVIAVVALRLLLMLSPQRVGDGSEYYALFLAIQAGHRTFMTEGAWTAYEHLYANSHILGLVNPHDLQGTFPSLIQKSGGADFNHFWFYSALVALTTGWLTFFGVSVHTCFLVFHALLLAALTYIAARTFGKTCLIAAAIVLLGSPIIWFIDKVHTEFFTFCCISIGTLLFCRQRYFAAAVWLALASTQNISIGATAVFLLAVGAWKLRRSRWSFQDVVLTVLALALVTIHPIYYFFRIGVIDPQLLAGGAHIGSNLRNIYIWIADPDVGLIPNWPASLLILAMAAVAAVTAKIRPERLSLAYVAIFLATNLYAQSSTENLNSGATIDIARYATWYIGLFIPCLAFALNALMTRCGWLLKGVVALVLLTITAASAIHFRPSLHESYLAPTRLSAWIQKRLPTLYNPPPQIFADRNTGGVRLPASYAILGPGCRKVLVVVEAGVPVTPLARETCGLDLARLPARILQPGQLPELLPDGRSWAYMVLSDAEREQARPTMELNHTYEAGIDQPSTGYFLVDGWWSRETWGVWSSSEHPRLSAKVAGCPPNGLQIALEVVAFVGPEHPKLNVQIDSADRALYSDTLNNPGPMTLSVDVPCSALTKGRLDLTFSINGQRSPQELGLSEDSRVLGLGLRNITLSPKASAGN